MLVGVVDRAAREARHNAGTGAKYTRSRRPVRIIYFEKFRTLSEARQREAQVKKMKKAEKETLVKGIGRRPRGDRRARPVLPQRK